MNLFLSEMDRLSRENKEVLELERLEKIDLRRKATITKMQETYTAELDKSGDGSSEGLRAMTKSKSKIELLA